MPKIFIDGQAGTTGLEIRERLSWRKDIELLEIDPAKRKDALARKVMLNSADLVILCLPDDAAIEAASLIDNPKVKVIDCSTAHRTKWTYGLAQLSPAHAKAIEQARLVANPGCHATGFIAAVYPLVQTGLVSADEVLHCFSLTGYSGGGKKMIAEYEGQKISPGLYARGLHHKHIPEMMAVTGLVNPPIFVPIVTDDYRGMLVNITLEHDAAKVHALLEDWYKDTDFEVMPLSNEGRLHMCDLAGTDKLRLYVSGNASQCVVSAQLDNLGKGACGAAIENMNRMLRLEEVK
jgi:N-acetyl-gamma-glutamyl-phosphate reductase